MTDRDHLIRERAYRLWEQAGRPEHGRDDFWHRASAEVAAEQAGAPDGRRDELQPAPAGDAPAAGRLRAAAPKQVREKAARIDSGSKKR